MAVLFISESYLKNNTVVDDNVDQRLIIPSITTVQDMHLHPILGTPLYEDLQAKIIASTLNGDEVTLINDYISKMLLQWTMYELTMSLLYKFRNKSVATKSGDNSQPIDYQDLQFLRDDWKNKAEFYDKRLINHLIDNKSLFPKYTESSDDLNAKKSAYTTSFYLGTSSDCWIDKYNEFK